MARIAIITPARSGARNGNRHTAQRWAGHLRRLGHRVSVSTSWQGEHCELMLALHARRSHPSIVAYRRRHPRRPLVVALTGTDLYKDLPASREARQSLRLADRVIVLQEDALRIVDAATRRKASVVYQSSDARPARSLPGDRFRIAVVGHLREEKDPFRAAFALAHLTGNYEVVQIGDSLTPGMAAKARELMARDLRYRWLGGAPHARALRWIASSHALVVSSAMEGGANVICEAARIGTPVLASRMSGNVGMLGRRYPGYYRLFDEAGLAELIRRSALDKNFYRKLRAGLAGRRALFAPAAERAALASVLRHFDLRL